jgi:hypothetical protein
VRHVTVPRLQALSHLRRNGGRKGGLPRDRHPTAPQLCAPSAPSTSGGPAQRKQARMSCNRRAGYDVREVTPPLAPMLRLLDCGTSTATRGSPTQVWGTDVPRVHQKDKRSHERPKGSIVHEVISWWAWERRPAKRIGTRPDRCKPRRPNDFERVITTETRPSRAKAPYNETEQGWVNGTIGR